MEQEQLDKTPLLKWSSSSSDAVIECRTASDNDSIQLQSPEAIALNGLLSDLEFTAQTYESMAERHLENWHGAPNFITNTPQESIIAYGIYANKAQDIRELVNKWKLNKK